MRADKAFDVDWLIEILKDQGMQVVISQKSKRRASLAIDLKVYQWRHLIENFFCKPKEYKCIALRSAKLTAVSQLPCILLLLSSTLVDSPQALFWAWRLANRVCVFKVFVESGVAPPPTGACLPRPVGLSVSRCAASRIQLPMDVRKSSQALTPRPCK